MLRSLMVLLRGFSKGIEWKELDRSPITGGRGMVLMYPNTEEHPNELVEEALTDLQHLNRPIFIDYGMGIIQFARSVAEERESYEAELV